MNYRTALINDGLEVSRVDEFLDFHKKNRNLWKEFEQTCLDLIRKGEKRWSVMGIFAVVRWKGLFKQSAMFKVNNNLSPVYSRVFRLKYPQYKEFFKTRRTS